eukprot:CAMPEP_0174861720 /NCGR_PEP_ID=MMETSP1114-20130205/52269_1 /TAXON_ID=312471 /ORGANISM="Neobodo designis, Strain CCAP 1951/1" /LENGTH=107 /DNA_ID=CAMNT_0016096743 /DNA_START=8 /DNA_END=328 /DNA_ORIENTATION=-
MTSSAGEHAARVTRAGQVVFDLAAGSITDLFQSAVTSVGFFTMICRLSLPLTGAFLGTVGVARVLGVAIGHLLPPPPAAEVLAEGAVVNLHAAAAQRCYTVRAFPRA